MKTKTKALNLNNKTVKSVKNKFSYLKDGSIVVEMKNGTIIKIGADMGIIFERATKALFEYQYLCEHYGVGERKKEYSTAAFKIVDRMDKSYYLSETTNEVEHDCIEEIENEGTLDGAVKAYYKANGLKMPKKAKKGKRREK